MDPEARLKELGLSLPPAPKAMANYRSAVLAGKLLHVAGQGPMKDGKVVVAGKLGRDVPLEAAREAARLTCLNALAVVKAHAGSLANVKQIVRATVWVNCTEDFGDQPAVADGATDLLRSIFGEAGLPARAAVGANALPRGIPVEMDLVVELK